MTRTNQTHNLKTLAQGNGTSSADSAANLDESLCIEEMKMDTTHVAAAITANEIPLYCMCNSRIGTQHAEGCPFPCYSNDKSRMDAWQAAAMMQGAEA